MMLFLQFHFEPLMDQFIFNRTEGTEGLGRVSEGKVKSKMGETERREYI